MYTFAWVLTLKSNRTIDLNIDYVEIFTKWENKVIYVVWETNLKTKEELMAMLSAGLWEILNSDISFSWNVKIQIMNELFEDGVYESAVFEWEEVTFREIKERFIDVPEVITIREWEISEVFKNRKINVDFLY